MINEQFSESQKVDLLELADLIKKLVDNSLTQDQLTAFYEKFGTLFPVDYIDKGIADGGTSRFAKAYPQSKPYDTISISTIELFKTIMPTLIQPKKNQIWGLRFYLGIEKTNFKVFIVPTKGNEGDLKNTLNTHNDYGLDTENGEKFIALTSSGILTDIGKDTPATTAVQHYKEAKLNYTKAIIFTYDEIIGFINDMKSVKNVKDFKIKFMSGETPNTAYENRIKVALACTTTPTKPGDPDPEIEKTGGIKPLQNYDEGSLYPPGTLDAGNSLFYP